MIARLERAVTRATTARESVAQVHDTPLLPRPTLSASAFADSIAILAMALSNQESSETAFASTAVAGHKREREFHLERVKERRDEQHEIEHGPGLFRSLFRLVSDVFTNILEFDAAGLCSDIGHDLEPIVTSKALWSDLQAIGKSIAKIAVALGAAALAGFSFGTASVPAIIAAALILSTSSVVIGESKCLDGLLGAGWSDRIAAGLAAASAIVTGGASALSVASAATSLGGSIVRDNKVFGDTGAWVGLGLTLGSGALAVGASLGAAGQLADCPRSASDVTATLRQVEAAAGAMAGGGKILEGTGGANTTRLDYVLALSRVDEKAAQTASDGENERSKWAVEQLGQVVSQLVRAREILTQVVAADAANGRVATQAWS